MFKVIFLCLVASLATVSAVTQFQLRSIDQVSYLVQLRQALSEEYICAGTLVNDNYVVTAAHCLDGIQPTRDIKVVAGTVSLDEGAGIHRRVAEATKHPEYNGTNWFANDVAVLRLDRAVEGPNTASANLCTEDMSDDSTLQVTGWDISERGYVSKEVHTKPMSIVPFEQCQRKYSYATLTNSVVCAGLADARDECHGISGAPAMVGGNLCGITSFGRGCAQDDYPFIFTNVNTVKEFIEGITNPK